MALMVQSSFVPLLTAMRSFLTANKLQKCLLFCIKVTMVTRKFFQILIVIIINGNIHKTFDSYTFTFFLLILTNSRLNNAMK